MAAQGTLQKLLERHRQRDLLSYNVQENHVPMVLIAMFRMGADTADLERYYNSRNSQSSPPVESQESPSIDAANWEQQLGNANAASAYCCFFLAEFDRHGRKRVLQKCLPRLMTGIAAHAFHPLLRLAYGFELNDDAEVAFGLGYWAATYLPAPEMPTGGDAIPPADLLNRLSNTVSLRAVKPASRSIAARINQFYSHADFRSLLQPLQFNPARPLDEISQIIADTFIKHHHFTQLHGVTSCHALRLVLPYCDDLQKVISEYWYAVCAAHLTVVNLDAELQRPLPEAEWDWPRIQTQAMQTGVEHTIKLAYTCWRESEEYERESYRRLAIRDIESPARFV